jgi:hypothetical protein
MPDICDVKLELLRPGPAHNQLLSPLTPYIALCGADGPVSVHFPFEHRQLLSRLERLRYVTPTGTILPQQREVEVRDMGEVLGEVLAKVPALNAELRSARIEGRGLIHLRLSLSASELALVPFEFAIAPNGFPGSGSPLFLQTHVPIALTREGRRGQPLPVSWNRKPRILFAFASPVGLAPVPAQEHLEALRHAIDPWVKWQPTPDLRVVEVKAHVGIIRDATLERIRQACAEQEFTHVHILAHGAHFERAGDRRYGLALCSERNPREQDVVDGESLALALTMTDTKGVTCHRPTVVSLATCDSGNQDSVLTPGGSIAHDLQAAGIPWVIASQFPLWTQSSVIAAEVLYTGLLRGDDPRWVLYNLRQRLRMDSPGTHDWASIVAYATIPADFDRQVETFWRRQTVEAINRKFDKAELILSAIPGIEKVSATSGEPSTDGRPPEYAQLESLYQSIRHELTQWRSVVPASATPQERSECLGMSGASEKRIGGFYTLEKKPDLAQAAYRAARDWYRRAIEIDPVNHWVITQYLSFRAILSQPEEREDLARAHHNWWVAARQIASWQVRTGSRQDQAWAYGTLAEIEMLGVVYGSIDVNHEDAERRIVECCRMIRDLAGDESFQVLSTCRQFQRYLDWWRSVAWNDLAQAAVDALTAPASG